MFNKFYKTIHNHYSKFFKIFYFLRYLIPMFLVATILYVSIPKFFEYEKKRRDITDFLLLNYQLELNSYSSIRYNIFPTPNVSLENVNLTLKENSNNLNVDKLNIYINFSDIYKNNFTAKRIFINKNKMAVELDNIENLFYFLQKIKLQLVVKDLDLNLIKDNKPVLEIKNINFSNYGFKKDKFKGMIFDKNFKISIDKEKKDLRFKLLDTGISAYFKLTDYSKRQLLAGTSRIDILNNYLKLNYSINKNKIMINKSKFRNKDLSFSFQNLIKFNPFFEMDLDIEIEKINTELFNKLNIEKLLSQKDIIQKLNSVNRITYKEKKIFQYNLIKEYSSKIYLENGRINELNNIKFFGAKANCENEVTLIDDPPRFYFKCNLSVINLKEFNKYFSISKKLNNKQLNFYFEGSINIFRNKINFEKISINDLGYIANDEDKIFFKKNFEEILLKDGIFNIFKTQKIKYFIKEVL